MTPAEIHRTETASEQVETGEAPRTRDQDRRQQLERKLNLLDRAAAASRPAADGQPGRATPPKEAEDHGDRTPDGGRRPPGKSSGDGNADIESRGGAPPTRRESSDHEESAEIASPTTAEDRADTTTRASPERPAVPDSRSRDSRTDSPPTTAKSAHRDVSPANAPPPVGTAAHAEAGTVHRGEARAAPDHRLPGAPRPEAEAPETLSTSPGGDPDLAPADVVTGSGDAALRAETDPDLPEGPRPVAGRAGGESADSLPQARRERWADQDAPRTLPDGDPLLTHTDQINTPERASLREELIRTVIGDAQPPERGRPILYLMGGGGASGKGDVLDRLMKNKVIDGSNAVHLDPDIIKTRIPQFSQIVAAGDSRAAEVVHEESSWIAKAVLAKSMEGRLNIIYDSTLGNPDKTVNLIDDAHARGYEVRLFGVTADPEVAVRRAVERGKESKRYVPVQAQLAAHRGFSAGFEQYVEKADTVALYDTNSTSDPPFQIVQKKSDGVLRVLNESAYRKFQRKSLLNPEASGPATLYDPTREQYE